MGVVVSHQLDGMLCGDVVLFHEVGNLWVSIDLSGGFHGLSPGEVVSLRQGSSSSSFPEISPVLGRVASLFVADEAFAVPNVFCSFTGRETDLIYIHSVGVGARGSASWQDIAISPSSELPKSYHIVVEFPSFVKPLFPLPASMPVRESGGSHHDGELLGYSSLEGIYQDAVIINSTVCLGQFEDGGVLVKVSLKLFHAEGVDSLVGSVFDVLRDKSFFKGFTEFLESLFRVRDGQVGQFHVSSFSKGGCSSLAQFIKEDQDSGHVFSIDSVIYDIVGLHGQEPMCDVIILSREVFW